MPAAGTGHENRARILPLHRQLSVVASAGSRGVKTIIVGVIVTVLIAAIGITGQNVEGQIKGLFGK